MSYTVYVVCGRLWTALTSGAIRQLP